MLASRALMVAACAALVLVAGTAQPANTGSTSSRARQFELQHIGMQQWFNKMDVSRDGQLQEGELRQFIGAQLGPTEFNTGKKLDQAVEQATEHIDSTDSGTTISLPELDEHLLKVLEGVKVSDWIAHSLGLPMYAEAFRDNAVTVLDFPLLVNDRGKLLETELMVTRVLHRQKIMQAMQRQMLGLGAQPGHIPLLSCISNGVSSNQASSAAGLAHTSSQAGSGQSDTAAAAAAPTQLGVVHCSWQRPDSPGEPPLHKYVLERFAVNLPGATWQIAAELDDAVTTQSYDILQQLGRYQYRVAAWNLNGRSAYAFSDEVAVAPAPSSATREGMAPDQAAAADAAADEQQQQQQRRQVTTPSDFIEHYSENGRIVTTSTRLRWAFGPLEEQQPQQQQQRGQDDAEATMLDSGASGQQQQQVAPFSVEPAAEQGVGQQPGSLPDCLVRRSPSSKPELCSPGKMLPAPMPAAAAAADKFSESSGHCSSGRSGDVSWERRSTSAADDNSALVVLTSCNAAPAAAPMSPAPAGPNVVWVVGQEALSDSSTSTPAAIVAQVQLLQSMQAAAGAAAAGAAGGGQNGHGTLGSRGRASGAAGAAGSWSAAAFIFRHVGKWLRAFINSLLLLVLPVCVRLLPVPVLHRLLAAIVRALQLLPEPVQQVLQQLLGPMQQQQQQRGRVQDPALVQAGLMSHAVVDTAASLTASGSNGLACLPRSTSSPSVSGIPAAAAAAMDSSKDTVDAASASGSLSMGLSAATAAAVNSPVALGLSGPVRSSVCAGSPAAASPAAAGAVGSPPTHSQEQSGTVRAAMKKSSSEIGLVRHNCVSSPGSSTVGGAVAASGPYAGIYGFEWQQGEPTVGSSGAVAGRGQNAAGSPEVTAVFAALTPASSQALQRPVAAEVAPAARGWGDSSSHGGQCYAPEQLLAASTPSRKRCAFPGCTQQFDVRHLRAMMQRHYCGRCQQAYCLAHTAYSPHGPSGGCGAESRCVCCTCFYDFTPEYRIFLASRNTLQHGSGRRTKSGPAAGHSSSSTSQRSPAVSAGTGGTPCMVSRSSPALHRQPGVELRLRWGLSRSSDSLASAGAVDGVGTVAEEQEETELEPSSSSAAAAAAPGTGTASKHLHGRMLWARAWTKASAVVRFSHAGQQHQQHETQQKQPCSGAS